MNQLLGNKIKKRDITMINRIWNQIGWERSWKIRTEVWANTIEIEHQIINKIKNKK